MAAVIKTNTQMVLVNTEPHTFNENAITYLSYQNSCTLYNDKKLCNLLLWCNPIPTLFIDALHTCISLLDIAVTSHQYCSHVLSSCK